MHVTFLIYYTLVCINSGAANLPNATVLPSMPPAPPALVSLLLLHGVEQDGDIDMSNYASCRLLL